MSAQDKDHCGRDGCGEWVGVASQALGFADVKFEMPRRHLGGTVR